MNNAINTHGLKMTGIRTVAGMTRDLTPYGDFAVQIVYDRKTGKLSGIQQSSGSWSAYDDPTMLTVCHANRKMTMQEIADRVAEAMQGMEA